MKGKSNNQGQQLPPPQQREHGKEGRLLKSAPWELFPMQAKPDLFK